MSMLKKILLGFAGTALVFLLFFTAIDFAVVRVLGTPEPIKHILRDSNIYGSVISGAFEEAKTQTSGTSDIPLNQQAIIDAGESAFTPQLLQTSTESVIDGVYDWLNGKVAQPDFRIDLSDAKAKFATNVGQIAKKRAAKLPACSVTKVSTENYDVFSAKCLPRGLTPAEVAAQARDAILHGKGFLENPVISADSLKSGNSKQSVFADQLKQTPDAYQKFKSSPAVLAIITLLALLAIVFLSQTRLKGLRHAGIVLAGIGVVLILSGLAVSTSFDNKVRPKIILDNKVLQNDIQKLASDSVRRIDNSLIFVGGIYALAGGLALGGYYWVGRRGQGPKTGTGTRAETPEPAKDEVASPPEPKTSAKKKIDVK